jgi:hypothetical protein
VVVESVVVVVVIGRHGGEEGGGWVCVCVWVCARTFRCSGELSAVVVQTRLLSTTT